MLFVDLHDTNPEGKSWTKDEEDKVSIRRRINP